jgi:hypothetical protein
MTADAFKQALQAMAAEYRAGLAAGASPERLRICSGMRSSTAAGSVRIVVTEEIRLRHDEIVDTGRGIATPSPPRFERFRRGTTDRPAQVWARRRGRDRGQGGRSRDSIRADLCPRRLAGFANGG